MKKHLSIALAVGIFGSAASTFAQDSTSAPVATGTTAPAADGARIQQWRSMTPEQRAEKRASMKNKVQNMTPEQKAAAKQQLRNRMGALRGKPAADAPATAGAPQ